MHRGCQNSNYDLNGQSLITSVVTQKPKQLDRQHNHTGAAQNILTHTQKSTPVAQNIMSSCSMTQKNNNNNSS